MKSVYIHIPFCHSICSYCDFCKFYYHKEWVQKYFKALEKEIIKNYHQEDIYTLYIGGGTPSSLTIEELKQLFQIIKIFKLQHCSEFTFECNIENIDKEKANFLYQNGVNRISIGIETFHEKHLKTLNRHHTKIQVEETINMLKEVGFVNINVDLIYALLEETIEEVKEDLNNLLKLDIPHISTYSLMIEPNTILGIKGTEPISEDTDFMMYQTIQKILKQNNFLHYEISNFSKKGFESKHNLVYWNNEEYYGFGVGASGYIKDIRYSNTRNFSKYIEGNYIEESHIVKKNEKIENELILGLRKIEGISLEDFFLKYHQDITKYPNIQNLIKKGCLLIEDGNIKIPKDKIYISNQILCQLIGELYE